MKIKSFVNSVGLTIIVSIAIILAPQLISITPEQVFAQSTAQASSGTTRLSGYAWSENIGWISFKDGSKPVTLGSDGSLNGYAWSENLGWIQFGGLSGFPNTTYGENAKIASGKITGWARVVSGVAPTDLTSDNRGGFDGWISLNGSNYGVSVNAGVLSGYAWGSIVTGWIDMSGVQIVTLLNSCRGPYGTNIPDGQNFIFFTEPNINGECGSQVRTCSNGVLSGSYTEISCGNDMCLRGGKTFNAGDKVTFFAKSIAGQGQTCEALKIELQCKDGEFVNAQGKANTSHNSLRCINNPSYTER